MQAKFSFRPMWSMLSAILVLGLLAGASTKSASAQASPALKRQVVGFYRWYVGEVKRGHYPIDKRATMRRYVSLRLSKWLASPALREYGADYFLAAQDFDNDWDRAAVSQVKVNGKAATATVALGRPKPRDKGIGVRRLHLKLVKESGVWKIDRVNEVK